MFCGCCNTKIDDDSCFCKKCGAKISANIENECQLFYKEDNTTAETKNSIQDDNENKFEEQLKEQVTELFF